MLRILRFCLLWLPVLCFAQEAQEQESPPPPAPVPESPELPPPVQSGEEMQPDITIIRKGTDTVQEFRRNGKLYMVKVKPDIGPAYYLIDKNGDEIMDVKRSDLDKNVQINQWPILEWE